VTEFFNHEITVGDLIWAASYGIMMTAGLVGFAVLAINRGWVK
jgi:hypothetical protein